jgi:hypothetical protein
VVAHFGHSQSVDPQAWIDHGDAIRDLNGDGAITVADISAVVAHFGETCT